MWGAAIAALGTLAASAYNSYAARENAEDAINEQGSVNRELAEWNALKRPALQVQGLKDAGINPALAYGSINSASAPTVSSVPIDGSVDASAIGQAISRIPAQASALKNQAADTDVKRAQETNFNANSAKAQQEIAESKSREALNEAKRLNEMDIPKQRKVEIQKLQSDAMLKDAQRELILNTPIKDDTFIDVGIPGFLKFHTSRLSGAARTQNKLYTLRELIEARRRRANELDGNFVGPSSSKKVYGSLGH